MHVGPMHKLLGMWLLNIGSDARILVCTISLGNVSCFYRTSFAALILSKFRPVFMNLTYAYMQIS